MVMNKIIEIKNMCNSIFYKSTSSIIKNYKIEIYTNGGIYGKFKKFIFKRTYSN